MKPGIQTSEFWITFLSTVIGLLVMLGIIVPSQANVLIQNLSIIVGAIFSVVPAIAYILGRTWLKSKMMNSQPTQGAEPAQINGQGATPAQ